jgi:hypothetical protein
MIPSSMTRLLFAFATLTTLASHSVFASTDTTFVSDSKGNFKPVTGCEIKAEKQSFSGRLKDLGENIVEIKDLKTNLQVGAITYPMSGTFWQVALQGQDVMTMTCQEGAGSKTYVLFDVFVPEQLAPVARMGVSSEQDVVFKSIAIHTPEQAEKLIGTRSLQFTSTKELAPTQATSLTAGLKAVNGSFDYIACISGNVLNVRDESLSKVLFTVNRHDRALPVQSFGTDKFEKVIGGVTYNFMKVQFPDRTIEPNIGWVADDYIKMKSQCANYVETPAPTPAPAPVPAPDTGTVSDAWIFPTLKRPTDSYKTGQRKFQSNRDGGARWHAAADLYRVNGEEIAAVTDGKIIRDRYFFYQGTYAIEVQHTGGKVVRYGEVTGKSAPGSGLGKSLSAGQTVGYVGTVNSGCCKPMLHFEMYTGTATGALTQSGNKFGRRKDLMDPTDLLTTWEKAKFGQSY